jgi:O-antigen/teichoic acid export membrane protein
VKKRYLTNVIWSWTAVGINMILAFLLAPYIIRKIGETDYGAWLLAMTLVEYFWLIDLGLRSATVKMSAEYRALGETSGLETLLSTAVLYSAFAGALLATVTLLVAPQAGRLFKIDHPAFPALVMVVGVSWAIGMVFNPFSAATEGFQRFDVFSRIWIVTGLTRTVGIVAVLGMGRGILEMGFVLFGSQLLMYALTYITFRRVVVDARLSWRKSSWPMFVRMARYGIHTFTASLATRLMSQSIPPLIAYLLPLRFVTYYGVPVRILDYGMEGIGRVGQVTMPNASDLMARGQRAELLNLGILTNRYSLAVFAPVTAFLGVYGFEVCSLWIRPSFAAESAYLLPVLLIGYTAVAGQFNSASILFGIGRHKLYARLLIAEAVVVLAAVAAVLPRGGLYGAVWVTSMCMMVSRGVALCTLASRELGIHPLRYAARIYGAPLGNCAAAMVLLWALRLRWLPGRNWGELIAASLLMLALYGALTWRFSLAAEHRAMVVGRVRAWLG